MCERCKIRLYYFFCGGDVWDFCLGLCCLFFFFSSRRRHTRCREVSWARRCVQETGIKGVIDSPFKFWKRRKTCRYFPWNQSQTPQTLHNISCKYIILPLLELIEK
eukprot:TRINITY_DN11986_c0_g1_i2.p3 TRINITY_DN11986_c0_g1~~TRINITY_DN11986_c0_g1_i2.p3  ORF type:complete len:106 (+),score=28.25 TRINITY_DN11986_c0_g1_i2:55-372(+)